MRNGKLSVLILLLVCAGAVAQSSAQLEPYSTYYVGQQAQTAVIGDFNGDGRDDVAVAAWPSAVYVFYQQQDGSLGEPIEMFAPNMPLGLAVGDLNADGRNDLAVGGTDGNVFVYYQAYGGLSAMPVVCYAYGNITSIAIGDLTGDGLADLAVGTQSWNALFVIPQMAGGGFDLPEFYLFTGHNGRCVTICDLNADGANDVAMLVDDNICCFFGTGGGGFEAPFYLSALWAHSLVYADANGDGLNDLIFTVATNQPDSALGVYAQAASGAFAPVQLYPAYDFVQALAALDIDGDGAADLTAACAGYEALTVHMGGIDGLGPFATYPAPYCNNYQPGALAAGDLNCDGAPDLALADPWSGLVVFLNAGKSDTTAPTCDVEVTGTPGANGWYVSAVKVDAAAFDEPGGSGLQAVYRRIGDGPWELHTAPLTLEQDGVWLVGFRAEDVAGNVSQEHLVRVQIDCTAPELALAPAENTLWPPSKQVVEMPVTVAAADAVSGLDMLTLSVVDEYGLVEPQVEVTSSPVFIKLVADREGGDKDGRTYTLVLTGTDKAGNTAMVSSTVTVPASSPKKPKESKGNKK